MAAAFASALDEHVEDFALAIDGWPEIHRPAANLHEYLIQIPGSARLAAASAQAFGDQRPEACGPYSDSLIAYDDAPLSQQFLDVAEAQCEPQVEPDRMLDDGLREAEATVGRRLHTARYRQPTHRASST
jgi:hypothetical protein